MSTTFAVLLLATSACSLAANSLLLPFTKTGAYDRDVTNKRQAQASLINDKAFYSVSLAVGSNSESNDLLVDTGSSDTFLLTSQFDSSASSSFYDNNTDFLVQYGGGTVSGVWGQDSVSLNGQTVGKLSFGLTSYSSSGKGLLGLGLSGLESTYSGSLGTDYQYSNFPILLKENGIIDATVFQVFLNDEDSSSGSILFGAVDTGKAANGIFYMLPIVNIYESIGYNEPVEYMITVQGMGTISSSGQATITTTKQIALIDTGATLSMVSSFVLNAIVSNLGATLNSNGYYSVSCDSDDSIVLDFGGFNIDIPVTQTFIGNNGNQCYIGLTTTSSDFMVFGDSFIRAMTIVFDLDNFVIALAQANFDGTSSIQETSGGIPNGQQVEGYSNVYESYSTPVSGGDIFSISSVEYYNYVSSSSSMISSSSSASSFTATSSFTTSSSTTASSTTASSTTSSFTTSSTTFSTTTSTTSSSSYVIQTSTISSSDSTTSVNEIVSTSISSSDYVVSSTSFSAVATSMFFKASTKSNSVSSSTPTSTSTTLSSSIPTSISTTTVSSKVESTSSYNDTSNNNKLVTSTSIVSSNSTSYTSSSEIPVTTTFSTEKISSSITISSHQTSSVEQSSSIVTKNGATKIATNSLLSVFIFVLL